MSSRERKRAERRKRKSRSAGVTEAPEGGPESDAPASSAGPPPESGAPEAGASEVGAPEAGAPASSGEPPPEGGASAASGEPPLETGADASRDGAGETIEDVAAEAERRGISSSEVRNERARDELEPLAEGERPTVVTIGALVSLAIALSILIAYAAGVKVDVEGSTVDERPNAFQVFPPAILFGVMTWGMWGARYWAVLGFQAIMAIIMIGAFLTLIAATTVFKAISALLILAAAAALFWFTVKALARIQMPTPGERDSR